MTWKALAPGEIAYAATLAATLEASASKPGNVGPEHDFGDVRFEDFLASAVAIGPVLGEAACAGIGRTVLRAVHATRRRVGANTNLGIILLFAPLASAAGRDGRSLRSELHDVLERLTNADAENVYAAIRLASPGGLGEAPEQDVRQAPTVTLAEAMRLAADRDSIAREYGTDYAITFGVGLPALERALACGATWRAAAADAFLAILAEVPDTLIARKCGRELARDVSRQAARVRHAGDAASAERKAALAAFDRSLRDPLNRLNPGTTADLTAATLFARLLEQGPSEQE